MASHRLLFFPLILLWIGGLCTWSLTHPELASRAEEGVSIQGAALEAELMEVLDQIVTREHSYHHANGQFTRMISRIGVGISKRVEQAYEIRVVEATAKSLKVVAVSDETVGLSKIENRASIDQDYLIRTNFPMPAPRAEFLRKQTERNLWAVVSGAQEQPEKGIFQGYFQFEKQGEDIVTAVGIKEPVLGMKLDSRTIGFPTELTESGSGRAPASYVPTSTFAPLEIEPVDAGAESALEAEALSVPEVLSGHRASRN